MKQQIGTSRSWKPLVSSEEYRADMAKVDANTSELYARTPRTPIIACIGDSIANMNGYTIIANQSVANDANGFLTWALALADQRVTMPSTNYCKGYPGQATDVILSHIQDILDLNPRPSVVVVEGGINNIGNSVRNTFEQITADLKAMYDQLLAAGIFVIAVPIPPDARAGVVLGTTLLPGLALRVNRFMREYARRTYGLFVADYERDVADPASAVYAPKAGVTYDLLHPNLLGGYLIGKSVAKILRHLYPSCDVLPYTSVPADALFPEGNLLTNPLFETVSGGSLGAGLVGAAPGSWTFDTAGITAAVAVEADPLEPQFKCVKITLSGTYTVAAPTGTPPFPDQSKRVRMYQAVPQAKLAVGDTLEGLLGVEVEAGSTNLGSIGVQLRDQGASYGSHTMRPSVGAQPAEGWSGVLHTGQFTIPAGGLTNYQLMTFIYPKGDAAVTDAPISAVIRFRRASLRKFSAAL